MKFRPRLPTRTTVRRVSFVLMILFGTLLLAAILAPGQYYVGPLKLSLRSTRNPGAAFVLCAVVWRVTNDFVYGSFFRLVGAVLQVWSKAGLGGKAVLLIAAVQGVLLVGSWQEYPDHVAALWRRAHRARTEPSFSQPDGTSVANIEHFAREICRDLPPDARILFHGHIEGMVFAYEVYPRRVFMTPGDYFNVARTWHKQRWLEGVPEDPLEPFWHRDFPAETVDQETFIREHGITHEVFFAENRTDVGRWRKL